MIEQIKFLDASVAQSKESGLYVPLDNEMQDVNGVRYKPVRSKKTCDGCCFSNKKNSYGVAICSRVRCACMFRQDNRDVIFVTTFLPSSMKGVIGNR